MGYEKSPKIQKVVMEVLFYKWRQKFDRTTIPLEYMIFFNTTQNFLIIFTYFLSPLYPPP